MVQEALLTHPLSRVLFDSGAPERAFQDTTLGGVRVRHYASPAAGAGGEGVAAREVVVYIHGGGWVLGSVRAFHAFAVALAAATRREVVSVEYRRESVLGACGAEPCPLVAAIGLK